MSNSYHTPDLPQNVTQQKLQQSSQALSSSAAPYSYLQQSHPQILHQHPSHHQILPQNAILVNGSPTSSGAIYGIDKNSYYTTTAAANTSTTHPNTILITNNFAQQQTPKQQPSHTGVFKGSNIRIISAPNVYSITRSNDKVDKNIFDTSTPTQHVPNLMSATYAPQQFAASALQSYFLPANADPLTVSGGTSVSNLNCTATNTAKVLSQVNEVAPMIPNGTNRTNIFESNLNSSALHATNTNNANSSTVVLDRINICINNHYNESVPNICSPVTSALNTAPAQQPSPIIPAIQHRPIIDSCSLGNVHSNFVDSSCSSSISSVNSISSSSEIMNSSTIIVIDEPDSTTMTQHTPPTTPENTSPHKSSSEQSPSSTTTIKISPPVNSKNQQPKACFSTVGHSISDTSDATIMKCSATSTPPQTDSSGVEESLSETLHQLQGPPTSVSFTLEEDVFIKRQDGRFYLGTIISCGDKSYLVRFDDKSEQWCDVEEMRKLGGGQHSATTEQKAMCVACKRTQSTDIVEICERCGRGYHRSCTSETLIGSGVWHCKRCAKPMKLVDPPKIQRKRPADICRRLPYHSDKLNWDEKHRINEEQIYCYCGDSGSFDYNMLQCCKCRNWFHTECMQQFKSKLLRGDSFFVFCCTVCNDGSEFIRRLQVEWADVLHLTLYNLRKQHGQKYQHLMKDIWPFVLENRNLLPICHEWRNLPETSLMERIKQTLNEETTLFICGREKRRGNSYYGLRHNLPPATPNFEVDMHEKLTDVLLTEKLKLTLLPDAPENECNVNNNLKQNNNHNMNDQDVYEFRINEEETSDDELPIMRIIDNAKKQKLSPSLETKKDKLNSQSTLDVADDNANDAISQLMPLKQSPQKVGSAVSPNKESKNPMDKSNLILSSSTDATLELKSSRKRKAFRLSKSYKEIAAKAYDSSRTCDLSSDENSSSSRGTSLDLIIPPPANFLGSNNPFLMVTPKKDGCRKLSTLGRTPGVFKSSIFNTTTLDFSSKLAHFKSAGIFPNLSTSNLAKAAGQPRTVRTVKRRLSAKDITIGPNQEVRRRRTRRPNSHVEVISTTTINPIPNNFFPIYAKDCSILIPAGNKLQPPSAVSSTTSSMEALGIDNSTTCLSRPIKKETQIHKITHGRLLRQRPQKNNISPGNSRRSSTSSNQSITNHNSSVTNTSNDSDSTNKTIQDLKKTVNKYFGGAVNRIEAGESYSIRAKRRLSNGQLQYLIEWGETQINNNIVSQ